ncbi:MAG: DMT family transporter [Planctomycetes bacterium]|nr:DMT family transporter [Planctomycetota bacterium]
MARWLFWSLATIVTWGVWAVLSKLLAEAIASPAHSQAISTLGVVPVIAMLWAMPESPASGSRAMGIALALGSGIVSCLGNIAYFDVLGRGTKAAAVVPITALYPMVTVLLAIPILKERLNGVQLIGIALSLVAIYLFNVPGNENFVSAWLLLAMLPIVLWGVCGLLQKMSTNYISARSSAIWFLVSFLPVAAFIVLRDLPSNSMTATTWAVAALVGFTLALGNFTILKAFASGGKASIIAPMAALYPVVSIPLAILALGESISWRESLGILGALAAVGMLSYQLNPSSTST